MKAEVKKQLTKQALWQKNRKSLSWEDKLRQSVRVRNSVRIFMHNSKQQ